MSEVVPENAAKLKESITNDILMRIFGGKLAHESEELPVRTSYVNQDLSDYNIIDTHYQWLKEEVLHDLALYVLKEKQANEKEEVAVRSSYVNSKAEDTPVLDAHYQQLKEEICHDVAEKLVADKMNTEKAAMAVRAAYFAELQQKTGEQEAEKIAVRLHQKGMSTKNIADIVNMSEEELQALWKK